MNNVRADIERKPCRSPAMVAQHERIGPHCSTAAARSAALQTVRSHHDRSRKPCCSTPPPVASVWSLSGFRQQQLYPSDPNHPCRRLQAWVWGKRCSLSLVDTPADPPRSRSAISEWQQLFSTHCCSAARACPHVGSCRAPVPRVLPAWFRPFALCHFLPLPIRQLAVALLDQQCMNRVATGAAVGGALGASIGAESPACSV